MAKKQNFIVGSTNPNTNTWTTAELNNGWDKYQVLKSGDLDGVFKAVSDYSNDSSQEIWNAIRILKGSNPTGASTSELGNIISTLLAAKASKTTDFITPLTSNNKGATKADLNTLREEIETSLAAKASKTTDFITPITTTNKGATETELNKLREEIETSALTFKGYVATSAPSSSTYGLVKGNIWINASAMPTTFPVPASSIRVWNGTSWATTTNTYTVKDFDFFRNINNGEGYYWFGGQWTVMSTDMSTDYFTLNQTSGKWEIKSSVNLPGNPTTTTPAAGTNSTRIATTAFVANNFAKLASPAFTGTPTAPTATAGTANTQIATTAFVATSLDGFAPLASPAFTGTPTTTTPTSSSPDNQIATKQYVDEAIAPLPTTTYSPDLFDVKWADHELDDMQWLRADNFSWQSGAVYQAAYEHLVDDYDAIERVNVRDVSFSGGTVYYYRDSTKDSVGSSYPYAYTSFLASTIETIYCDSETAYMGKTFYTTPLGTITYGTATGAGTQSIRVPKTETISGITIAYYEADDKHKIILNTQVSNAMLIYNATGVAWYYVLDTTNERFILPRTKFGFTGLRDGVGKYVAPGLPNITGMISMINPAPNDYRSRFTAGSGALRGTGTLSAGRSPSTSETGNGYPNASLNASWSDSIYGNSTTVQAPATQMYLYFYVGSFTQTALENTAGLNAELFNGKADTDLSNVLANIDFVVESQLPTAANNYTWYRKYRSGWVEQGGCYNSASGTVTVSFPVQMADSNYTILKTMQTSSTGTPAKYFDFSFANKTTTSAQTNSANVGFSWQVSGMAAN